MGPRELFACVGGEILVLKLAKQLVPMYDLANPSDVKASLDVLSKYPWPSSQHVLAKNQPLIQTLGLVRLLADAAHAGRRLIVDKLIMRGNAKQLVHPLQTDTLGLGYEEPDKDEHDEVEASKHEEHAVTSFSHGLLHCEHGCKPWLVLRSSWADRVTHFVQQQS